MRNRNPFTDEARRIMLDDDDDITPLDGGTHPPRGCARRGSVSVALDQIVGEFVAPDKPTPDPPDLAIRRVSRRSQ